MNPKFMFKLSVVIFALLSLVSCRQDVEPDYDYISFEMDGNSIELKAEYDSFWNTYIKSTNQDQLGLVLQDENKEMLGQIYVLDSDFLNKTLPYTIDKQREVLLEGYAEMSLINLTNPVDTLFNNNDSINFVGYSYEDFTLTINAFEDSVLSGDFFGVLKTRTGKTKNIENGQFKVKIDFK
ncbi:MAG: hypothetical protein R3D00_10405 [Bacteroidia bacterium]